MNTLRTKAEEAVREAGKLLFRAHPKECSITKKGFANFVTEVDYAVQEFLIRELLQILPGSNVISEEADHNRYVSSQPTWVLDPVDGTTNFMYAYRHSAISLALFMEGKPVLGIVFNPDDDEMFVAEAGKGAFLNGEQILVSGNECLEDGLIAFGTTPYDRSKTKETFRIVEEVYSKCRDIRRTGSAALDLAYIACGRLDGFFELVLQPWDYAAGMLLVEEAGGIISNWQGEKLLSLKPNGVLAANSCIYKELLQIVR